MFWWEIEIWWFSTAIYTVLGLLFPGHLQDVLKNVSDQQSLFTSTTNLFRNYFKRPSFSCQLLRTNDPDIFFDQKPFSNNDSSIQRFLSPRQFFAPLFFLEKNCSPFIRRGSIWRNEFCPLLIEKWISIKIKFFRPPGWLPLFPSYSNLKDPTFYPIQHTKVTYPLKAKKKWYKNW